MQDLQSGEMRDLTPFIKDISWWFVHKLQSNPGGQRVTTQQMAELLQKQNALSAAIQSARDAVQPDRAQQGPVFFIGENIEIRGGKFRVDSIEPGFLHLKSLPA